MTRDHTSVGATRWKTKNIKLSFSHFTQYIKTPFTYFLYMYVIIVVTTWIEPCVCKFTTPQQAIFLKLLDYCYIFEIFLAAS